MENEKTGFEQWAIVELMGHNQIAGWVTEDTAFGVPLMRVDVPAVNDQPAYTKWFGGAAIYAITPVTQEMAITAAARIDARPVSLWIVPEPKPKVLALPGLTEFEYGDDTDDGWYDDDDDDDDDPSF